MREVTLYHGNNGDHEFWEARNKGVCITKQQGTWLAYKKGFGPRFEDKDGRWITGDLDFVAEMLRLVHRIELKFATDHIWTAPERKKMVLRKVEV